MFKIGFPREQFISPTSPSTHIEQAVGCDGTPCGCAVLDNDGNPLDVPPHFHLVESQAGAWTRPYAIGGEWLI